jgi:hypothetical protein
MLGELYGARATGKRREARAMKLRVVEAIGWS